MNRVPFRSEIHAELSGAVDKLIDRYALFGFLSDEVVELCLYQGITKTRIGVDKMEAERAALDRPREDGRERAREAEKLGLIRAGAIWP